MAPEPEAPTPEPGTLQMLARELEAGKMLVEEGRQKIDLGLDRVRLCASGVEKILKYYPEIPKDEKNAYIAIKEQCEQLLASVRDAALPDPGE